MNKTRIHNKWSAAQLILGAALLLSSMTFAQDLIVGSNTSVQTTNFTSGTNSYFNTYVGYDSGASNNLLSVSGSNTLLSNSGDLIVGVDGSSNRMVISGGSQVFTGNNINGGVIGLNSDSSNNSVIVTGAGSLWSNSSQLSLGSFNGGFGNSLVISNGGTVTASSVSIYAGNSVLVTGINSLLSNSEAYFQINGGTLTLDQGGQLIANGGQVSVQNGYVQSGTNLGSLVPGLLTGNGIISATNGGVSINAGCTLAPTGTNSLTFNGNLNFNSGTLLWNLFTNSSAQPGVNYSAPVVVNGTVSNSSAILDVNLGSNVTSADPFWSNNESWTIMTTTSSILGSRMQLSVSGNSSGPDPVAFMLQSSNNNLELLYSLPSYWQASNALWTNDSNWSKGSPDPSLQAVIDNSGTANLNGNATALALTIGDSNSGNTLIITNGAQLNVIRDSTIGYGSNSSNNSVTVAGTGSTWSNGGNLTIGLNGSSNSLVITTGAIVSDSDAQIGSSVYSSNTVSGNTVLVTGSGSLWSNSGSLSIYGGTLSLQEGGAVTASSISVQSSVFNPSGTTYNVAQGMLSGNGTVTASNGVTITSDGKLAPKGTNSLTINGNLTFNGGNLAWNLFSNSTSQAGYNYSAPVVVNGSVSNQGSFHVDVTLNGISTASPFWSTNEAWTIMTTTSSTLGVNASVPYISGSWSGPVLNAADFLVLPSGNNLELVYSIPANWQATGTNAWTNGANWDTGIPAALTQTIIDNGGTAVLDGSGSALVLSIGNTNAGNSLIITNGGQLNVIAGSIIGNSNTSSNNAVTVTGSGSTWSNGGNLTVGYAGSSNSLTISSGGMVADAFGSLGATNNNSYPSPNSSNNSVLVTGGGSLWSNSGDLNIGLQSSGNSLIISNGGTVADANGNLGGYYILSNNSILVTGPGSLWSNSQGLTINQGSTLALNQGGQVVAMASVVTNQFGEVNNAVTVNGTLSGNGTVIAPNGGVSIFYGGTIAPTGTNALTINGNLNFNGGSLLWNLFNNSTAQPGVNYSAPIVVNGSISNNYMNIAVNLGSNVSSGDSFWSTNQEWNLISASNAYGFVDGSVSISLIGNTNGFNPSDFLIAASTNGLELVYNIANTLLVPAGGTNFISGTTASYESITFGANSTLNILLGGNLSVSSATTLNNNSIIILNGSLFTPSFTITPGSLLMGSGFLYGNLFNGGVVKPGNSPGTFTINGNYVQTATGNLNIQIAGANSFDQLVVNGTATLGGTLNIIPYDGYTLQFGQKFGFLTANTISGAFSSIEAPAGYRARFSIVGDPVATITIAPQYYEELAVTQNQTNVAKALDSFIAATNGDKLTVSTALDNLTAGQYQAAFNAIMPTIYQSESTVAFNLANAQNQELLQRLWGVRLAGTGFSMSGLADNTPVIEGQGDGKGVLDSKKDILRPGADNHWGMFVDGNGIFAKATSGNMLPTYNSQSGGITTGLTYKWNEKFGTGIYAGYEGSYNKYSANSGYGNGSTIIDNSVRFGVFGTYGNPDGKGFHADGLVGGGYNNYNVSRAIAFQGLSRTATSSPGAGELDSLLAGGYDFKRGNWTYGPTTSLQYTYFGAQAVNEQGAQSLDFSSGGWQTSSLLYSLGGHAAYTWQANKDLVVVPQINLSWQHEFLQNPYNINGSLGGSPSFNNTSSAPLRDTLYTGVGVTLEYKNKWNTSFFYNASAGNNNLTSQNIFWSAGVKF